MALKGVFGDRISSRGSNIRHNLGNYFLKPGREFTKVNTSKQCPGFKSW
jgi:hypothetical protein